MRLSHLMTHGWHGAGDVAAMDPMPPDVAVWLLSVAGQEPANGQRASWVLPLAVGALHRAVPQPAPSAWLKVCIVDSRHFQLQLMEHSLKMLLDEDSTMHHKGIADSTC